MRAARANAGSAAGDCGRAARPTPPAMNFGLALESKAVWGRRLGGQGRPDCRARLDVEHLGGRREGWGLGSRPEDDRVGRRRAGSGARVAGARLGGEAAAELEAAAAQLVVAAGRPQGPQPADVEDEGVALLRATRSPARRGRSPRSAKRQPAGRQRDPGADVEDAARRRRGDLRRSRARRPRPAGSRGGRRAHVEADLGPARPGRSSTGEEGPARRHRARSRRRWRDAGRSGARPAAAKRVLERRACAGRRDLAARSGALRERPAPARRPCASSA